MEKDNFLFDKLTSADKSLDRESVHQLRKGTKQLRAHLQLMRQLQGQQKEAEQLRQSVKELARMLAGQRDTDVMSGLLQELIAETRDQEILPVMQGLQQSLNSEGLPRIDIKHLHKLLRDIDQGADKLLSQEPEEEDINPLLEMQLTNLCTTGQSLLYADSINWDDLHNWRKSVKKLIYQYKLKKHQTPTDLTIMEELEQLGEHLGKVNDFNILGKYAIQQQNTITRAHTLQAFTNFQTLLEAHKYTMLALCQQRLTSLMQWQCFKGS